MAYRTDIRESEANRLAGITNNQGCADLSMFLGRKGKTTGSFLIADPSEVERRQPPLPSGDSVLILMPERRRIVAQVRRKALKKWSFLRRGRFSLTMRRFVDNNR
jgi:hypothetical protein